MLESCVFILLRYRLVLDACWFIYDLSAGENVPSASAPRRGAGGTRTVSYRILNQCYLHTPPVYGKMVSGIVRLLLLPLERAGN